MSLSLRTSLTLGSSFVAVLVACGSSEGAGEETGSEEHPLSAEVSNGIATFYDADGSGNCSFDKSSDLDVAALAMPLYAKSASCGACLRVTGPKGSVTVRVVDSCPPCEKSGVAIDLSASAFAKIAEPSKGRIDVRYQQVSCSAPGNVSYHFKDGSSQWWTAIQVRNHRLPIAKLEYEKNGGYVAMTRESYNYFVAESGVGKQASLKLRVTATNGRSFEETLPGEIPSDKTVPGEHQFD